MPIIELNTFGTLKEGGEGRAAAAVRRAEWKADPRRPLQLDVRHDAVCAVC